MGFHWGMLFMLGVLFVLAGGLVAFIVIAARAASSPGDAEPSAAGSEG